MSKILGDDEHRRIWREFEEAQRAQIAAWEDHAEAIEEITHCTQLLEDARIAEVEARKAYKKADSIASKAERATRDMGPSKAVPIEEGKVAK